MERNSQFYERLLRVTFQSVRSTNQVGRELGYTRNTLHNYKNGSEPSGSRLLQIANYFSVSSEYLIGKSDYKDFHESTKVLFEKLNEKEKNRNEHLLPRVVVFSGKELSKLAKLQHPLFKHL